MNLAEYVWDIISLSFILFILSLLELEVLGYGALKIYNQHTPLLALVVCIVFHELAHLIPLALTGYKLKMGIAKLGFLPVIYIDIKGPISKNIYVLVALSPILLLQPALLLLANQGFFKEVFKLAFIMNQASSAGDLIFTSAALKLPPGRLIRDTGSILLVDLPKPYGKTTSLLIKLIALALFILILTNLLIQRYSFLLKYKSILLKPKDLTGRLCYLAY